MIFCEEEEGGTCERRERSCNDGLACETSCGYRWPCTHVAATKHAASIVLWFLPHKFLVALLTPAAWVECAAFSSLLPKGFAFLRPCSDLLRQIQRMQRGVAACFLAEKLFHRPPCHRRLGRKLAHPSGVAATPVSSASPLRSGDNARRTKGVIRLPQPVP